MNSTVFVFTLWSYEISVLIVKVPASVVFHCSLPANKVPPDHVLLDSAPNLEVLKLLFQQFLNLSTSQRDISGPILGALSNNRCPGGTSLRFEAFSKVSSPHFPSFSSPPGVLMPRCVSSCCWLAEHVAVIMAAGTSAVYCFVLSKQQLQILIRMTPLSDVAVRT